MSDSTPNYPRGTPYKAPPDAAPGSGTDFRAFAIKLALATLAAVLLIVGLGAFLVMRAVKTSNAGPVAEKRVGDLIGGPGDDLEGTKSSPVAPDTRPKPTVRVPSTVSEKPPVEKKSPPPRESLLDAVGGLIGAHLHQGYLNIGLLADAQENDIYSPEDAKKVLSNVTSLLDNVDQQIAKLTDAGLDDEDRKKLDQARAIGALLRTQGKELRAYWETPEKDKEARKEHETKYFKSREEAWTGIKELLEIKE